MAVTYSVRFKKMNFAGKLLVEKEGEIVFDRKYFRLKGKGANDHGEIVNFIDIRDTFTGKDKFTFMTFSRETYELSRFGDSVENFLTDFYRIRNDFFAENLFMREGMLMGQFDCSVELSNQFGKSLNKGVSVMQIFEESILFLPKFSDAFSVNLNFMRHHDFLKNDYLLQIETDSGTKINVSKLGSHFEECQEILDGCLEKMYQRVLTQLNEALPGFSLQVLLKLAYAIKSGKAVELASLKKLDASLPQRLMELAFGNNPEMLQKIQFLRGLDKDEKFYLGLGFVTPAGSRDTHPRAWFLSALPSMNLIIMGLSDHRVFFLRLVMEYGIPADRLEAKVLEINQCMVLLKHDLTPLLKDKHSLKKTRYRVAILRMSFLRLFRRSMIGISQTVGLDKFKDDANRMLILAKAPLRPLHRPRTTHPAFPARQRQ